MPLHVSSSPFAGLVQAQEYKAAHGKIPFGHSCGDGGYDITKWPRSLRALYAYDGKDLLADIPLKDLKENKIMLAFK